MFIITSDTKKWCTTQNIPDDYSHKVEVNSDESNAETITNRQYEIRLQANTDK